MCIFFPILFYIHKVCVFFPLYYIISTDCVYVFFLSDFLSTDYVYFALYLILNL